jgi:hypothetical protein
VAGGQISRAAFADFFESLGPTGPVEAADAGETIEASSDPDAFLASVHLSGTTLVFPSYSFIANLDTQFTTIASVPEKVACLFTLSRGSGEVVLEKPALFEDEDFGPRLRSKGELRGFAG